MSRLRPRRTNNLVPLVDKPLRKLLSNHQFSPSQSVKSPVASWLLKNRMQVGSCENAELIKLNYGTNKNKMKAKLALVTLTGLTVCTLALAQNEPAATPPADPAAAPAAQTTNAAPPLAAPEPAATPATNAAEAVIPLIQFQQHCPRMIGWFCFHDFWFLLRS